MILECSKEFSSAHFYNQPHWTDKKNQDHFGKCYTPYGHGHNYKLIVTFIKDTTNNQDFNSFETSCQKVLEAITSELDHKHLNFDIPEFKNLIPTTENISLFILNRFKNYPEISINKLVLKEMDSLWVEIEL